MHQNTSTEVLLPIQPSYKEALSRTWAPGKVWQVAVYTVQVRVHGYKWLHQTTRRQFGSQPLTGE